MKSSRETLKIASANKYKRWIPAVRSEVGDPRSAQARFDAGEHFVAAVTPRFRLSATDRVFTIGSCFARNVEAALMAKGVHLLTSALDIDPSTIAPGQLDNTAASVRAVLNKYSTSAIRSELERAFGQHESDVFIEVQDGLYVDPHLALLRPMPKAELSAIRAKVDTIIRSVRSANVVFITLGLTETWFDNKTQCYLNSAPPPTLLAHDRGRFAFENSPVTRAIDDMQAVVELLRAQSEEVKIIVTVSPVPMNTTFTGDDVVIANTYSKSVLRVTAQHLRERYDFVDYFPSYEMVMSSPRSIAWAGDQLHVKPGMVGAIVEHFLGSFFDTAPA